MNDLPAELAGAGAELDHEIGLGDRGQVVFHHHDGISGVPQAAEQGQEPVGVSRVEADGRLIEDVQGVHQPGAEGVAEGDALGLAAGEGTGLTVEGEISEAHIGEEAGALADLVEDDPTHSHFVRGQGKTLQPRLQRLHREGGDLGDGAAVHADREGVPVEPGSFAGRAAMGHLVLSQEDADVLLVALGFEVAEKGKDADVLSLPAVQQLPADGDGERFPRGLVVRAQGLSRPHQELAARLVPGLGPRIDGAILETAPRIGNDQRFIVFEDRPEAVASGAGSPGMVEGEERRRAAGGAGVAGAAGIVLGEPEPGSRLVHRDGHALALGEGGGDRLGDASRRALRAQPVHDHHHRGRIGPGHALGEGVEGMGVSVHRDSQEAELAELGGDRLRGTGHGGGQGESDLKPPGHGALNLRGGLGWRVAADPSPADPAEGMSDAGPEDPEEVPDLGGGPDRGPARGRGGPLFDGHCGGEPLDPVHIGLGHPLEELLGVGGQGFDVAPLALGVERVEGKGALSRTRGPRHHDATPVRQLDGDALQVVLAGVDDAQ